MVVESLQGLPAFIMYFCVASIAAALYLFAYTRVTAHDEFALIAKNMPGAAVALSLSLLGFALPLASAIAHAANILDCAIWALIALTVQIGVYYAVRIPVPDLSKRIEAGELAPAIWLGGASITAGLISSASMSY
jgi:putative membrane protein